MNYKIRQGEDLILNIPVLDDNNNKVDLSTTTKIRLSLFIKGLNVFSYLDQTKETPIAGYGDITVNTTDTSIIDLNLTREQSKTFPIGEITCSVLLEFPDAVLTNKRYEYEYSVGDMEKGYLKSEVLT